MGYITGSIKRIKRKISGHGIMNKAITAVFIVSSVITPLSPVFATTAYADEPETATVTLMDADNGSLSFEGTDDKAISVNVGSEVTVNVTPDDGYYADSLTIFNDDEEGAAVDVVDGSATFTVSGNTTVAAAFNENGSAGADALKPVEVSEQSNTASIEDYVLANADAQYVGGGDELSRKDVLTVTTTVVDGSKLTDATLDKLWEDTDGDGMADNYTAMLSQAVSHAVLFEVDPDADYYVGWVGADIQGAKLTDWAAAENNADAVMRDGFIMDEATGLVYVPKAYTKTNDEGQPMVASSRIQLVYTVQDASANATFDFSGSASDSSADGVDEGKVSVPVVSAYARVTLSSDGAPVDGNLIDSVTVNGIEYTSDMDMWSYDEETGTLEFFMAPAGIHCMSVNMSSNLLKSAASFFGISTYATSGVNNIGTWEFNSTPQAGFKFKVSASNTYGKNHSSGGILPAIENPSAGNYENKTIYQALGTQGVDLSKLKSGNYSIMRSTTIHPQTTSGVTIPGTAKLGLTCGHVGVNQNFQLDSGYNDPSGSWTDELGAQVNVVAVYGSTAIIGVVVPTSNTQAGGGFFEINWKLNNGYAKVKKVSANPSITDGNDCYSLKGAEFTVYNGGGSPVGTLTTDESGNTNTIELPTGTYTLKETKTPNGYLKAADQQFTVNGGQTTTITVADPPSNDPMAILLGKFDGQKTYNGEGNLPQGSASLAGAEFTIEYYDTLNYDSYDAIKDADVKPTRTWVVSTDNDGFTYLDDSNLVSGDSIYHDASNNVIIPRGTVVVYESKAPEGYLLNKDFVSFQKIQETPSSTVTTYNMPTAPETVKRGGVKVQKLDTETGQTPQGGASLEGITFSIINDNDNSVIVNGKEFAPGEVALTITTDKDGVATTEDDALPYGSYIIRETGTNDSYLNTSDEIHATISEHGTVYDFTASDDVIRGGIEFDKRDAESGLDAPLGDAAPFDGTEFEITTLNDNPVIVDGVTYSKGDVVKTLVVKDGHASTSGDCLPYGKYSLREVKATEGYNLNDDVHEFSITENGAIVNPFADTNGVAQNQVKRSDLEFSKKQDDTAERLAGVAFKVTSNTTGESHVVVTDENGYFSSASSWNAHTNNTNGNDWALSADGIIDSSKLDPTAGVWFGLVSDDGSITQPNDSLGAFPYDSYTIEELRCTANDGYQLINTSVIISRDSKTYDFGTLDDVKPTITTNASDALDGDSSVGVGEVKVFDKVSYADLIPGRTYKLAAELHDAKTGDAIKGSDGKAIKVEKTFTPEKSIGSENVEISLSTYDLAGKTITVYERLYDAGGSLLAEHTDKDDVSQQVTVVAPEIGTTATDSVDGDKNVSTDDAVTVTDSVAYKNLIPGKEYTLKGTLHVKKTDDEGKVTEEALVVDGKPVTAETTFTPETASGTVEVKFTFDSRNIADRTDIVAFESLEKNGVEIASHTDIEDVKQTVTVTHPVIGTTALDGHDGDKTVVTDGQTSIVDTVEYKNLIPGKEYTLKGTLYDKATGEALIPATEVGYERYNADTDTWQPFVTGRVENEDGSWTENDVHQNEDGSWTLTISGGSTDGDTGKSYLHTETVDKGEIRKVKQPAADAKPITAETTFTPEKADGKVDVTFTFDSTAIPDGTEVVAFESLEKNGVEIAVHSDIEDENQTVSMHKTEIGTTASDSLDGDKQVVADTETSITDEVAYKDILTGTDYTMAGILMDADTGLPILTGDGSDKFSEDDVKGFMAELSSLLGTGTEDEYEAIDLDALNKLLSDNADLVSHLVVQTKAFTPDKYDGTVSMDFGFNANDVIDRLSGETKDIVVYEVLFKGSLDADSEDAAPVAVATERDLDNEDQTVTLIPSVISTTATDKSDGDHTLLPGKDDVITDTVSYDGLIPGKEYTLKATLYDKSTGKPLSINDKHVTAELKFTPNNGSGTIDIDLGPFDATSLDGHDLVVFEELYKQSDIEGESTDVLVAEHKDINDEGQTVSVTSTPKGGFFGKTGGSDLGIIATIIVLVVAAGGLGCYAYKNRRVAKQNGDTEGAASESEAKATESDDDSNA